MTDEIARLTVQLSKLKLRRTAIIKELSSVEKEHNEVERKIKQTQHTPHELIGTDAKKNPLHVGDNVIILMKGKHHERHATVTEIQSANHIVITYHMSRKQTWRAGHNLLKFK